jgi:hypothetical protein
LTSAPQPVGAVVAYLLVEQISALLPLSFAFAAGAMLAPNHASLSTIRARTTPEFSPIPAVKTKASSPGHWRKR